MARPAQHHDAAQNSGSPTAPAVGAAELWRLVAPWAGHAFLALAAILGLFTASGAGDQATYAAGLATFAVAALLIAIRVKRLFDGREVGFLLPVSARSEDSLLVSIAALGVLGLVGAVLAATVGGTVYGIGLALFAICAGLIFIEIKRYFDRMEHRG